MKITRLRLKNFAAIDATLHKKEIEIDFSKMVNPICLFIGPIGSCKTYIMSQLQPFAYMGKIDVRSGEDMIIPSKKEGEKEICYLKDNGDTYRIHHHYIKSGKRRNVKSYVEKNGVEMNPSGLVTSFNQIIEIEFGIDIGFLKILRLGSNVNSLVGLSSTERKEFAVKLLSEVDDYLVDYKNATSTCRELNTELGLVVDKLNKIGDEETVEETLKLRFSELEGRIWSRTKDKEILIKRLAEAKGRLERESHEDYQTVKDRINGLAQESKMIGDKVLEIGKIIEAMDYSFAYTSSIDSMIDELKAKITKTEMEYAEFNGKISVLSKSIEDQREHLDIVNGKIKAVSELNEIEEVKKDLLLVRDFDKRYSKYYTDFHPKCTKKELLEDFALMQTILSMIGTTREFSDSAREIYYNAYESDKDPRSVCLKKLVKLKTELTLSKEEKKGVNSDMVLPEECKSYNACPYYKALKLRDTRPPKAVEDDIYIVEEALKVCDCLYNIHILLSNRKGNFPYHVEFGKIVYDVLKGSVSFFDFEENNKKIIFLEKYEEWIANRERMEKLEKNLELLQKSADQIDASLLTTRTNLMDTITKAENELGDLRHKRKKLSKKMERKAEELEGVKKYASLLAEKNTLLDQMAVILNKRMELVTVSELLTEYEQLKTQGKEEMKEIDEELQDMENEKFQVKVKLNDFIRLREAKAKLEKEYNHAELIRNAVSSTRGIPLLYLNAHFGRAKNIANQVIRDVCGDDFQLEMVEINENEFRIPYTKNGVLIPDIVNSSQGETSISSMALSFGLIEEFIGADGYNIMLLDEVDGPLDKTIRSQLLRMLEKRMEAIHATQMFVITHSPLFENYPVDVFVTIDDDGILDGYKNVNRIN